MFAGHHTYLLLNIITVFFPLILSFDKKVAFYKKWRFFLPAMVLTGAFFVLWDIMFTDWGVWSFNPDYLIGVSVFSLPIEEWMFFATVPYACVFIYECLRCWFVFKMSEKGARIVSIVSILVSVLMMAVFHSRYYTGFTFGILSVVFALQYLRFGAEILRNFIPAYLISVIPFFLVNGILTSNPVVIYNNAENLGLRIWTVPVEDIFYGMLLILMNISIMELFRQGIFARRIKTQTV